MGVPGFTADSAAYRTNGHYRTTPGGGPAGHSRVVVPQDFCTTVECPEVCRSQCHGSRGSATCERCLKDCRWECLFPGSTTR